MKTLLRSLLCAAVFILPAAAEPPLDAETLDLIRVVEDKDGFVNVRTARTTEAKSAGKVSSGCAVSGSEVKDGWRMISDDTGAGRDLFIHDSRLKSIAAWKQTAAAVSEEKKTATVKQGALEAIATAVPFEAEKHKVAKPQQEGDSLKIDGHHVHGTDGEMPDTALKLQVSLNGESVTLPASATHDLYQPNLGRPEDFILLSPGDPAKHALLFMWGSDGAGGYFAVWSFVNGKYAGRTVFAGF
jgi:hypothetical protein